MATLTGTNLGPWAGVPPSGMAVSLEVLILFPWDPVTERFTGERIWFDRGFAVGLTPSVRCAARPALPCCGATPSRSRRPPSLAAVLAVTLGACDAGSSSSSPRPVVTGDPPTPRVPIIVDRTSTSVTSLRSPCCCATRASMSGP